MTRNEAARRTHQDDTLRSLGFTQDEAEKLRRISMTLQRWFELECGNSNPYKSWAIERDGDEDDSPPYMVEHMHVPASSNAMGYSNNGTYRTRIPDRETGARKRLAKILAERNGRNAAECLIHGKATAFIQTDPRGAALYILRPGDVPAGSDVSAYYSRGICVY